MESNVIRFPEHVQRAQTRLGGEPIAERGLVPAVDVLGWDSDFPDVTIEALIPKSCAAAVLRSVWDVVDSDRRFRSPAEFIDDQDGSDFGLVEATVPRARAAAVAAAIWGTLD